MEESQAPVKPGDKVRITQQIVARDHAWATTLTGTVVDFSQRKTGSWFAHSKGHRLWLDRLTLQKDDGEISILNLDQYTRIEVLPNL